MRTQQPPPSRSALKALLARKRLYLAEFVNASREMAQELENAATADALHRRLARRQHLIQKVAKIDRTLSKMAMPSEDNNPAARRHLNVPVGESGEDCTALLEQAVVLDRDLMAALQNKLLELKQELLQMRTSRNGVRGYRRYQDRPSRFVSCCG